MKRIMTYTAIVLATVAGVFLLWQFRLVFLLFVLSLSVAAMFRPTIDWLIQRGLPRPVAQGLVYLGVAGGAVLLILLAGNAILQEVNEAANVTVIQYEQLHRRWEMGDGWQQAVVRRLPQPFALESIRETELGQMLPSIMSVVTGVTSLVAAILLILALGLYWSSDQYRFERLWLSLLPAHRRVYARDNWRDMEASIGNYLRSQAVQSVLAALALGGAGWLAGYPYPFLIALTGALGAFIPLFGGVLTAMVALALGTLHSNGMAIAAALYVLLVFLALELVVEPRLWPRERRSFLLALLITIPMLEAFGIWGLLAAPLLAAVLESFIRQAYQHVVAGRRKDLDLEALEQRYKLLSDKLATTEDGAIAPELRNLAERLATLLADSHATVEAAQEPAGTVVAYSETN